MWLGPVNGEACGECNVDMGVSTAKKSVPPLDAVSSDFGCSFFLIGELDTKSFGQNPIDSHRSLRINVSLYFLWAGAIFGTCPRRKGQCWHVLLSCAYSIYLGWGSAWETSSKFFPVSSTRRTTFPRSHLTSRRSFVSWMLAELRAKC